MFRKTSVKVLSSLPFSRSRYGTHLLESPNKAKTNYDPQQLKALACGQESKLWKGFFIDIAKPTDSDSVLRLMEKHFFCDDPLSKSLNLCYKKMEKTLEFYVSESLSQGMTIIAREFPFIDEIAGVCINQKSCKWDGERLAELANICNNINARKFLYVHALMAQAPDLHEKLEELAIFDMKFISVKRQLQGQGLSLELARHSLNLARDLNYKIARIDTTNNCTRSIAEKFSMKKEWDASFNRIVTEDESSPLVKMSYPNAHAAVYYINLKTMPENIENLGAADDWIVEEKKNKKSSKIEGSRIEDSKPVDKPELPVATDKA